MNDLSAKELINLLPIEQRKILLKNIKNKLDNIVYDRMIINNEQEVMKPYLKAINLIKESI